MTVNLRCFIVDGSEVTPLSQKKRRAFVEDKQSALPEYAGLTINMALVQLEVRNRRPYRILQIDCFRFKVNEFGAMDGSCRDWYLELLKQQCEPSQLDYSDGVLHAENLFEARRVESKYTWKLTNDVANEIASRLKI